MSKIKFYLITDSFFIFIATFFISFALIKYNGVRFAPSLISSSFIGVIVASAYVSYSVIKDGKIKDIEKAKKLNELLAKKLAFMDEEKVLELLVLYYNKMGLDAKIEKSHVVIESKKLCVFNMVYLEQITTKDVILAYKQTKKKYSVKIMYYKATSEALSLVSDMSGRIYLCGIKDVYNSLEKAELLPELEYANENKKIKIAPLIKGAFKKEKAGKFLFIGITLLILSLYTFYPIYYIFLGCCFIIVALTLKFFKKDELKSTQNSQL